MNAGSAGTGLPILLLPGLGGDARMFARLRAPGLRLSVPAWLPPRRRETLVDYAARMAAAHAPPGPFIVGGASFGGMVAWEMAAHCRPAAVMLIGSCPGPEGLAWWLRRLAPLAGRVPVGVVRLVRPFSSFLVAWLEAFPQRDAALFARMARDTPPTFLAWAIGAIAGWRATRHDTPLHAIHGARDPLMPPARLAPGTELIPRAAHLISVDHPRPVARLLARLAAGA